MNPSSPTIATTTGHVTLSSSAIQGFLVASGTPTLTLYDGTSTGGKKILDSLVCVAGTYYPFPAHVQVGLYATFVGAGSISFFGQG